MHVVDVLADLLAEQRALDPIVRFGAPLLYAEVFGVGGLVPPADRFGSLEEARDVIESEPPFRVLLEMGANESALGGPLSRGEVLFESWPPSEASTITWQLDRDGSLVRDGAVSGAHEFIVNVDRSQELTKRAEDDDDGIYSPGTSSKCPLNPQIVCTTGRSVVGMKLYQDLRK